ncbi:MAG: porin family protein [Planctomycetota bacterium]
MPVVGAGIGALLALFMNPNAGTNRQLDAMGLGAMAGSVLLPFALQPAVDLTAQYNFSRFGVRLDGFYYAATGNSTLDRPIDFGGASFAAGTDLDSGFRVAQARLSFLWTFVRPRTEGDTLRMKDPRDGQVSDMALSLLVGAAWVRYDATVTDDVATGIASESLVLPQVGLLLEARSERWVFEASVAGGSDGTSVWGDGRASVGYAFGDWFSVRGGYRFVYADLDANGFAWAGYLEGFYFGVGVHF